MNFSKNQNSINYIFETDLKNFLKTVLFRKAKTSIDLKYKIYFNWL